VPHSLQYISSPLFTTIIAFKLLLCINHFKSLNFLSTENMLCSTKKISFKFQKTTSLSPYIVYAWINFEYRFSSFFAFFSTASEDEICTCTFPLDALARIKIG